MGYDGASERSLTIYHEESGGASAEKPTNSGAIVRKKHGCCSRRCFQVAVAIWMSHGIPPLYRRIRRCQQGRCHTSPPQAGELSPDVPPYTPY
ncbi:hypothetical protein IWQ56_002168 [Coemansia nantahalensis]|nr:hypothetical protein IWQ56_002168 [Coemansia nantahalensis]